MEDDQRGGEGQGNEHMTLHIREAEAGKEVEQQVATLSKIAEESSRPPQRRVYRSNSAPPLLKNARENSAPPLLTNARENFAPPLLTNARENSADPSDPGSHWLRFFVVLLFSIIAAAVVLFHVRSGSFRGSETFYPALDALYFTVVTLCTTGYGDIVPDTTFTKLFTCVFILIGVVLIQILLNELVTYICKMIEKATERMRNRKKVVLALAVFCIAVGTIAVHYVEKLDWVDSFYLALTSAITVGYGDFAITTITGRCLAIIWLLPSTLAVTRAFSYLGELWNEKKNRRIAQWVLQRNMTLGDLVAADLDKDGTIRKSEFVIHKLKEMGKIAEKDILQICQRFDSLYINTSGKITIADLIGHPDFAS